MGWYTPLFKRGNALAQKKKTAATGGKKDTKKKAPAKKPAAKKPTQPKLTAAERKEQKEAAAREATVMQRVGAEVLGVVLIALGILLGLYLYRTTDAPLGVALQKVLFGSVGVVSFGLPPFLLLLGVFSIAGRKRMPEKGRVLFTVLLVVFVAALMQLMGQISVRDGEGKIIPIAKFIVDCFDRAASPVMNAAEKSGGGVVGGLICYVLEWIGGRTLCSVVVIAGIVVCLLFITRISLRTFPEILKSKMADAIERLDEEAPEDDYDEVASEPNALPARKQKSLFIQSVDGEAPAPVPEVDPDTLGHLEDIPQPGGMRRTKAAEPPVSPKKKSRIPFDEAFFVPEVEEPRKRPQGEDDLSFFPSGGPLAKKPKNGPTFLDEPIDDVLRMPGEEPLPANKPVPDLTPEAPKEELFKLPPRRSKISRPGEAAELKTPESITVVSRPEGKAPEMDKTPLEELSVFGREAAEPAAEKPAPTRPADPKNMTMDDLKAFTEATPYEEGEAPLPEPERAPDKKFVYHDEATGEALPEPMEAPRIEYQRPSLDVLKTPEKNYRTASETPEKTMELLIETLASFNIECKALGYSVGPVVTRYELQPARGVRVNRITTLSNDLALALAAPRVRIEAPIPGKAAVGVEVPNKTAATVLLKEILDTDEFRNAKSPVTMAIGKDIGGKIVVADLSKMPHMLIAGSTGSGKSVCINDIILSMVYKSGPEDLRLIMVDPKQVELSVYSTLPHLLIPVVTDPKKAASALRWAVNEMTLRYKKFSDIGAREITRYNELQEDPKNRLPRIVVIIDELADLMMVAPDEVEDCICRIAQLGRAAAIHLIVATQRPSADVITGLIKANIPSRAAFAVSSAIDSRIILDSTGAEKLLGRGDCLFHPNGAAKPTRLQAAFVSDEEVEAVVNDIKAQNGEQQQFDSEAEQAMSGAAGGAKGGVFGEGKQEDELLGEAVRIVLDSGQASISMIQRKLRVGYARAARLVDMMEEQGYVSGFDGSKPRKVLIKRAQWEALFGDGSYVPDADASDEAMDDEAPWDEEEEDKA